MELPSNPQSIASSTQVSQEQDELTQRLARLRQVEWGTWIVTTFEKNLLLRILSNNYLDYRYIMIIIEALCFRSGRSSRVYIY